MHRPQSRSVQASAMDARVPAGMTDITREQWLLVRKLFQPNRKEKKMTSTLHTLDRTGDTRIEWDPSKPDEVEMARKAFQAAKDKKYLIYKTAADGGRGELLREFDPSAERIVCTAQIVGG